VCLALTRLCVSVFRYLGGFIFPSILAWCPHLAVTLTLWFSSSPALRLSGPPTLHTLHTLHASMPIILYVCYVVMLLCCYFVTSVGLSVSTGPSAGSSWAAMSSATSASAASASTSLASPGLRKLDRCKGKDSRKPTTLS